jgi:predicted phosphodiesterase
VVFYVNASTSNRFLMKVAFISDIHSNLPALEAVLRAIERYSVDAIYCLGDIVGYGAQPGSCIDLVRQHCTASVLGNHDEAVAKNVGIEFLPKSGQAAARHNQRHISDTQRAYLSDLPYTIILDNCTLVHATPLEPEAWVHIESFQSLHAQFAHFETDFCFLGHTHMPGVMANKLGVFRVRPGCRYIINVGSVGQPRDQNPRAAFVLFDTVEIVHELVRVPYDIEAAANAIREAGLPKNLYGRLRRGE